MDVVTSEMVCFGLFAYVVMTCVFALILRWGVLFHNICVGGAETSSGVPVPTWGWALLISLVHLLASSGANLVITRAMEIERSAADPPELANVLAALVIALTVEVLILVVLLTLMLPTSFGRAILVTLCCVLITIPVGVVILLLLLVIVPWQQLPGIG